MIYTIPLTHIEAKILNSNGVTVDLDEALFNLRMELRTVSPNDRFYESKTWIFDNGNDIMG